MTRTPDNDITSNNQIQLVQIARDIGTGGGINGVAYELERQFLDSQLKASRYTLSDVLKIRQKKSKENLFLEKLMLMRNIVAFTTIGTIGAILKYRNASFCSICHGDVLWGKIYVNHGLHRAMLASAPSRLRAIARNPFHLFLLGREWIRLNFHIHEVIVCFSKEEEETLLKYYPKQRGRIEVIPNGVDTERFAPNQESRTRTRASLGIQSDHFCLIFVGHEFRRKGLDIAIDALSYLPERAHLIVVGGSAKSEIEASKKYAASKGLDSRVQFLGTRRDVDDLMRAADAFVLPTHYETWALVGLEAMACGTPVLMTEVGGIKDYVRDGENGYFIQRTPEDVAQKAKKLINAQDQIYAMRAHARKTAINYSWPLIAEKYIRLIRRLALAKPDDA